MSEGWICLHRELLSKPIWAKSSPEQKAILITLLLMANHEPAEWEWQGHKFIVERGQMVTSLESICEKCGAGVSIQNVRTALTRFEKAEFLTNVSTKTGRLITICNYSDYQDKKDGANKASNKDLTKTSQRPNKDLTTNNNDNNKNNKDSLPETGSDQPIKINKPNGKHTNKILFEKIAEIYNDKLGSVLPTVQVLSDKRQRLLKARCSTKVKNRDLDNPEFWERYFGYVAQSDWLTGKNQSGWTADFDWLIEEKNFIRVIEGSYHNNNGGNA